MGRHAFKVVTSVQKYGAIIPFVRPFSYSFNRKWDRQMCQGFMNTWRNQFHFIFHAAAYSQSVYRDLSCKLSWDRFIIIMIIKHLFRAFCSVLSVRVSHFLVSVYYPNPIIYHTLIAPRCHIRRIRVV